MDFEPLEAHRLIAPFLVTGLSGTSLTAAERELLAEVPPAGVILFHRNVRSMEQLIKLNAEVRDIIEKASGTAPLIMADHEGGRISVLADAIGAPPSQMAAWAPRSEEMLSNMTALTARWMKRCGLNLALSPVADVASQPMNPVIGTRAFGEDTGSVSDAVRIAVRAISGENMLSCLKHFPGHGSTSSDSHLSLPVIGKPLDRLREEDMPPFRAGIEEGAPFVMTGHLALERGDPPASMDARVIRGILRDGLGFDGVVITDALEMAGALPDTVAMRSVDPSAGDKPGGAVPSAILGKALEAGNDLLLMSRPAEEVYAEIGRHSKELSAALSGGEAQARMKSSRSRISSARNRVSAAGVNGIEDIPSPDEGESCAYRLFDTLFGDTQGLGAPLLPVFTGERADFESEVVRRFIYGVLRAFSLPGGAEARIDIDPVRAKIASQPELLVYEPVLGPGSGRCLIVLCRRPLPEAAIGEMSSPFDLVVAAERPWDAGHVPQGIRAAVTYGTWDMAAYRLGTVLEGTSRR